MMTTNWKLFYKENEIYELQFAELQIRDRDINLRIGPINTHGKLTKVDSFEETSEQLIKEGWYLQREWVFDRKNPDYGVFVQEVHDTIKASPNFAGKNALALITCSDFSYIGYTLHYFEDIENTDDEKLWVVDEWRPWEEDWDLLDPANRWLNCYGWYEDHPEGKDDIYFVRLKKAFQDILRSFSDTMDILLIYHDDEAGPRLAAKCMEEKLGRRMLMWSLGEELT
jgi:hypothetical protein